MIKPMPLPPPLARPSRYRTPPGKRVIHVLVPEATFVHVHKMALESGLRFSHYLARFLDEAFPHPPASGKVGTPLMRNCSSTIQLIRTIQ